ncbi:MAG: hypothetical protein AAFV74_18050 [Pseudomonadota bacterium]
MTDFGASVQRLYRVGITSVHAAIMLIGFGSASFAEAGNGLNDQHQELANVIVDRCMRGHLEKVIVETRGLERFENAQTDEWLRDQPGEVFAIGSSGVLVVRPNGSNAICEITHDGFDRSEFLTFFDGLLAAQNDLVEESLLGWDVEDSIARALVLSHARDFDYQDALINGLDFRSAVAVNTPSLKETTVVVQGPASMSSGG